MHPHKRHRQKGGSMLESVLTLVVFLALFFGVFDVGEMLFVHQTLTDRARNAARWGAVNTYDATSITNLVLYNATTPAEGQHNGLAPRCQRRPARGPRDRDRDLPGVSRLGLPWAIVYLVGELRSDLESADPS